VERLIGPVPAGFPRRRQRPPVPDRTVGRRHRRRPRTGGPGGDGQHGPRGLQLRRRPGVGGLAEADHGLDGRQSARRQLGNARHSVRRPQGRGQSHAVGLHQRLRHVGSGMLALVVASLPPRQCELRGLRARRGDARHPIRRARNADEDRLRRPRRRPAVRHRGGLRGGHVERPDHPRQLRQRRSARRRARSSRGRRRADLHDPGAGRALCGDPRGRRPGQRRPPTGVRPRRQPVSQRFGFSTIIV
jgi:hypothetical protein